jgi:hypothetical protein
LGEIPSDPFQRLSSHRNDPLPAPLAQATEEPGLGVEVA